MRKVATFSLRISDTERAMLARVAQSLQRSQGDAVRWLIRNAAVQLGTAGETSGVRIDLVSNTEASDHA